MSWELIEHTADAGIRVRAEDLDELFAEAARAVVGIMGHGSGAETRSERVTLEAPDLEALLVDWLSEMLYLFEARDVVPTRVEAHVRDAPRRLEGVVAGPSTEDFVQEGPQVKAITYHGLQVRTGPDGCEAVVYVDV